jgi:dynein regulatory complex protein 1
MSAVEDYGTSSNDKEERKRIRRLRVEKANTSDEPDVDDSQEKDTKTAISGQQMVDESLANLDRRKHTGLQLVTNVRVTANDQESVRRIEHEDVKKNRLAKLQQEALTSAKANAAIDLQWAELLEKEIPQELHQEIQLQMAACNAIIKSKDGLIGDFQQQLRAKDEEYVRTLRQHVEDIDQLLNRIRNEFHELQAEYEKALDDIEEAYLNERERLIEEHTGEIDSMFEQRRNKEVSYKETKQRTEEMYQREVEELITRGADQHNKLKIELEMNIQALKQQLEEIRATYQLNTEKLDYNYRVLTELDVEKNAELARYKRRLNKLKAQLNNLITKFTEMEASESKINHDLTEDYRSLTLKYKDLQAKFRHFEIADTTKYDEVWTMHEEEVKDFVDQLLKADKIITEQMLGWQWQAPDIHSLQQVLGRQGGLGLAGNALAASVDGNGGNALDAKEEEELVLLGDDPEAAAATTNRNARKVAGYRVRAVLKVLATEAGFMINPLVAQSLESMPGDEADVSRAETMLKALGIKSEEKLHTLVNYFFRDKPEDVLDMDVNLEEEGDFEKELALLLNNPPEEVAKLKDMIRPEDVIAAVKAYIEDMSVEAGPVNVSSAVNGGTKVTQEEMRIAQKRLASMRNYWIQLSQVVNDDTVSVWRQLEGDCHRLREMLNKRAASIAEVDALTQQNAQLKSLLNVYLGDASTNAALKVPPSQVMKVRDIAKVKATTQAAIATLNSTNFKANVATATVSTGRPQQMSPAAPRTGGAGLVSNKANLYSRDYSKTN